VTLGAACAANSRRPAPAIIDLILISAVVLRLRGFLARCPRMVSMWIISITSLLCRRSAARANSSSFTTLPLTPVNASVESTRLPFHFPTPPMANIVMIIGSSMSRPAGNHMSPLSRQSPVRAWLLAKFLIIAIIITLRAMIVRMTL
jgi:hypothetical protein